MALYYQVWRSASSFTKIDFRRVAIQMPSILLLTQKQCHEIYLNSVLSYMIQCMKRYSLMKSHWITDLIPEKNSLIYKASTEN